MRRLAFVLLCATMPRVADAQDAGERCFFPNTPQTRQYSVKLPSGQYNTFLGGGVNVRCPSKELRLSADSLESYGDDGRIYLVGDVHYIEPRLTLSSDFLTYFQRDERILAQGSVNALLPNGSTLRGPTAEYFRTTPYRPVPRMVAVGRPTITVLQKDSAGKPAEPMTVVANNVSMVGDSLIYAGGGVTVSRQDVTAYGDSMDLDSERELVVLMRGPRIEGKMERPFQLSGERIEMTSRMRKLDRVRSKGRARALSEDLTLASDTIELRVAADLLQRAIAWGPSRARAASAAQRILADSIDVLMPNQRVHEMHAVRDALAEGRPDTARFHADTLDWMRGDTILARFDTASADSTKATRLRELVAIGHARSFSHLPPADSTIRAPAINYVVGRRIVIAMREQRVSTVTVIDRASGVYLEPKPVALRPPGAEVRPATPEARPARPPR